MPIFITKGSIAAAILAVVCSWAPQSVAQPAKPVQSLIERRQSGVVMQRWDLSCGAAALATVLRYQHGDTVTERDVALGMMSRTEYLDNPEIVTFRQGFSLLDLKRFADNRGYSGVGLGQLTLDALLEHTPIIVPISLHGYRHFVVVRGVHRGRVLLADPAFGNRTMPVDKFERSWLELPEVGRVGLYVERTDRLIPPNELAVRPDEFPATG